MSILHGGDKLLLPAPISRGVMDFQGSSVTFQAAYKHLIALYGSITHAAGSLSVGFLWGREADLLVMSLRP